MASTASRSSSSPVADELAALRPALHRYASRMVGSVLDGEDVVQEAIARAVSALDRAPPQAGVAPWLFRITHNAAVDFLRSRERASPERNVEDDDMISGPDEASRRFATRAAMSVFLRLPPSQRGTVILKDVLGYSNEEIADILGTTVAASKAALHRGRAQLRIYADEPPAIRSSDPEELTRLQTYVDRFNARDFDGIRTMLADEVRFDLVARLQGGRSAFETYFTRYAEMSTWLLTIGWVGGRLAAVVTNPADPGGRRVSLIVIDWTGEKIARLRDFYHAPYALEGAEITLLA